MHPSLSDLSPHSAVQRKEISAGLATRTTTKLSMAPSLTPSRTGPLPQCTVFHGTDRKFSDFDMSDCLGAHFGTEDAAIARLQTTGRLKTPMTAVECDNGQWIVEECPFIDDDPIEHGPFPDEGSAETFILTAEAKRKPFTFTLDIHAPLQIEDLGGWTFSGLLQHLASIDLLNEAAERDHIWSEWNSSNARGWTAMREAIFRRGYDSIAYTNDVEDKGSTSWIALRPEQITPAQVDQMEDRARMRA